MGSTTHIVTAWPAERALRWLKLDRPPSGVRLLDVAFLRALLRAVEAAAAQGCDAAGVVAAAAAVDENQYLATGASATVPSSVQNGAAVASTMSAAPAPFSAASFAPSTSFVLAPLPPPSAAGVSMAATATATPSMMMMPPSAPPPLPLPSWPLADSGGFNGFAPTTPSLPGALPMVPALGNHQQQQHQQWGPPQGVWQPQHQQTLPPPLGAPPHLNGAGGSAHGHGDATAAAGSNGSEMMGGGGGGGLLGDDMSLLDDLLGDSTSAPTHQSLPPQYVVGDVAPPLSLSLPVLPPTSSTLVGDHEHAATGPLFSPPSLALDDNAPPLEWA